MQTGRLCVISKGKLATLIKTRMDTGFPLTTVQGLHSRVTQLKNVCMQEYAIYWMPNTRNEICATSKIFGPEKAE